MSLAIDVDTVVQVMLGNVWHKVLDNSFDLDSYEYLHGDRALMLGGTVHGVPATGFTFIDLNGFRVSGPVSTIQAVRCAGVT